MYGKAWHWYATFRQTWGQFRQLLKTIDLRIFRRLQKKLERRLDKSPNKMTRKITEYLKMPQLRRLFRFSPEERVALGPINTNRVEGFFAQMRVTLDGLRNAPDTTYVRARLALLRDFHNLDLKRALSGAGVPVRCLNAAASGVGGVETAVKANRRYADFDAVPLEGVGHFPMLERPHEFNARLREVLERMNARF